MLAAICSEASTKSIRLIVLGLYQHLQATEGISTVSLCVSSDK